MATSNSLEAAASGEEPGGKRGVAAVERALSILDAFDEANLSLSLSRISQITGLYKSTVLRLIETLEDFGYIRRLQNGEYQLGPAPFRLGMLYQQSFNLGDYVLPVLQEVMRQTNESSSFYVREGQHRICLFRVESNQVLRDHVRPGDRLPLRQGASGKVLTAFEAGIEVARRPSPPKLVAVSIGERQADLAAVAAPVFDANGRLAGALSVSGARTRFSDEVVERVSAIVAENARLMTVRLGGNAAVFQALSRD